MKWFMRMIRRLNRKTRWPELHIKDWVGTHVDSAVKYAVDKVNNDPDLCKANPEVKRAEANQWARHWMREYGREATDWEYNFLIEYWVGQRKGRL